jgi:hypothetical protein
VRVEGNEGECTHVARYVIDGDVTHPIHPGSVWAENGRHACPGHHPLDLVALWKD